MPTHAEERHSPFTPDQLFDLVADIERYPEFLPWCVASRVRRREGNTVWADLIIGFKMFRERFTSKVTMDRAEHRIDVAYSEGPFRYLNNHWRFKPAPDGGTLIDFYVDFEFRSVMLQKIIGALFGEAVKRMVAAFEHRAEQLYAPQGVPAAQRVPGGRGRVVRPPG